MGFRFASCLVFLLFTGDALAAAAHAAKKETSTIVGPAGYRSVLFIDDFSTYRAGAQPFAGKWVFDTGTSYPKGPPQWGTGEVQTYTNSTRNAIITSSGTLLITPLLSGGKWTSARLETTKAFDFACPAGKKIRMQAVLRVGNAPSSSSSSSSSQLGIWPAFWALGSGFRGHYDTWPAVSEVDVLEMVNGAATVYQTVHCGTRGGGASGGPCNEPSGLGARGSLSRGVFHTVAVEIDRTNAGGNWRGEKLVWYVDDKATMAITGQRVNNEAAWNVLARGSKFLLLNVAVGGALPNALAGTTTPTSKTVGGSASAMEVKYVAVFST